jgi:hypothetical protein
MSLARAIHALWSTDHRLAALAPLFSGVAAGGTPLPYVVLEPRGARPELRTSSGRTVARGLWRFHVRAAGLAQARCIAAEIARLLDRRDFDRAGARCLLIQRREESAAVEAPGTWRLAIDFMAMTEHLREV